MGLKRRVEIMKRGLRMAPEKVKKRRLYCLLPISIVVLFSLYNRIFFIFCDLNV